MSPTVLGLDVGGANLKAAAVDGSACSQPFDLWKDPAGLPGALRGLLGGLPSFDLLAVTMTGELCDCFENKRQGVNAILDAVALVAGAQAVRVWQNDGALVELAAAREHALQTAGANWLALATYASRLAPNGAALLLDVGSTTTDVVPLLNGKPVPTGRLDPERLKCGELVYTGVRRTPLCAILGPEGAAELFATTLDVYLFLGKIAEDAGARRTADGRPATRAAAEARLARMLCADLETCSEADRRHLVLRVCNRQAKIVRQAVERVAERLPGSVETVIVAGSGEFLARAALDLPNMLPTRFAPAAQVISLAEKLGTKLSDAACAYALAVLASERSHGQA